MITHYKGNIPFVDTAQMKEVDRIMTEDLGISLLQMMENAGHNLAILARKLFLVKELETKKVIVAAGPGGNGGGAMVAARRLKNWGVDVKVILSEKSGKFNKDTVHQFSILQKMKIPVIKEIESADLIIDGMIGYGINGDPKPPVADLIEKINKSSAPVLSLDAPSGLDLNTGKAGKPTIRAKATMTLAIPKLGLFKLQAARHIGDLYLADISVPPNVFKSLKIETTSLSKVFREGSVVKINKVVVFS